MKVFISAVFFIAQFFSFGQTVQTHFNSLAEARKHTANVKSLQLNNQSFEEKLPSDFLKFKQLNKLSLNGTKVGNYAQFFTLLSKLPLLDTIELHYCTMIKMPAEIGLMIQLKSLTITEAKLEIISPNIGLLIKLTSLDLSQNKIVQLPVEIGDLINLTEFNLHGNSLRTLSDIVCSLKKLETIDVVRNNIGELPACISEMSSLKNLFINSNPLKYFPVSLKNLKLENISFSSSYSANFPYEVFEITALKSISIFGGKIDSLPQGINALKNLNYLYLSNVEIGNSSDAYTQLSTLNIKKLYLHGSNTSKIPKEIALLTSLEELKMLSESISYDAIFHVSQMSNLKRLEFGNYMDSLLPPQIGNLKQLKYLEIISRKLNTLPSEIGQLISLQELRVMAVLLTIPKEIGMLKNLTKLNLALCGIEKLPNEIGQLAALQELNLNSNELKDLPPGIGQLSMLKKLTLSNNKIEFLPKEMGYLAQLETLDLFGNNLQALDSSVCNLANLKNLNVSNNFSLASLPAYIGQLHKLEYLSLSRTQIFELPVSLKTCSNLKVISLCAILVKDKRSINRNFKNKIYWSDNCNELETLKTPH